MGATVALTGSVSLSLTHVRTLFFSSHLLFTLMGMVVSGSMLQS